MIAKRNPATRENARLACTRLSVTEIHLAGDFLADNDRFCQSLRVAFVIPIPGHFLVGTRLLPGSLIRVSILYENQENQEIIMEFYWDSGIFIFFLFLPFDNLIFFLYCEELTIRR